MKLWDYFSLKIEFSFPLKMLKMRSYFSFLWLCFKAKYESTISRLESELNETKQFHKKELEAVTERLETTCKDNKELRNQIREKDQVCLVINSSPKLETPTPIIISAVLKIS